MKLRIHTDGGARGNPGSAAVGVVIEEVSDAGESTIASFGKTIGETTNNVAEYTAVVEALTWVRDHLSKRTNNKKNQPIFIQFLLDSLLVVNQLNGKFKIKEPHLRELLTKVRILEQEIACTVEYGSIPREQNRRADLLVNKALDEQL